MDTSGIRRELQEQLAEAVRRGQQQLRQYADHVRAGEELLRSQAAQFRDSPQFREGSEQLRRGQDAAAEALRTATETAQAIREQLASVPVPPLAESAKLLLGMLPSREEVLNGALELAGQLQAAQRRLTERVMQEAAPLITQGTTRVSRPEWPLEPTAGENPDTGTAVGESPDTGTAVGESPDAGTAVSEIPDVATGASANGAATREAADDSASEAAAAKDTRPAAKDQAPTAKDASAAAKDQAAAAKDRPAPAKQARGTAKDTRPAAKGKSGGKSSKSATSKPGTSKPGRTG